ncbi:hypothetical protein D9756_009946 [Leucocoprinus leucothites]|uniref:Beta-glucuronidase C-terminal domain-containing protein n=1 Tax=Leucocoprinus leucothites TaxID=201217 RepID=A0A8H5FRV1_9AGAR|nr:hypothetical protein D9756_009946 [Leucoagaricus leucothites]
MRYLTAWNLGLSLVLWAFQASAEVTIYGQIPLAQTLSAAASTQTALAAYDDTVLTPPPVPSGLNQFPRVELQSQANAVQGLSIPHTTGSFFGFSIEMSVINQLLGKNSTFIQVPFLNLVANIQDRAGYLFVRLGGNTQEDAAMVFEPLDNYRNMEKENKFNQQATTLTPAILYTIDMFYAAANISQFVNVNWFLGIPFNTTDWRLDIAIHGQAILGDKLAGLQAGNEPDFYSENGRRTPPYQPQDYNNDLSNLIQTIEANPQIPVKNKLIGPSVASITWGPDDVWNTGFIDTFKDHLFALSAEHYPDNNCAAQFGGGTVRNPQDVFPNYLTHKSGQNLCNPYLHSTQLAQQASKPFIMFETNSASCGGFAGVSDSYGAALWAMDYGFQMAYSNFSNALLHFGGQNVFYNAFTPPPTNQSTFHQWTAGAIYYSILVLAEAFGQSNTSQIMDMTGIAQLSEFTPAYAIYENGQLSKAALFNYVDDVGGTTGKADLNVTIALPNGGTPQSVKVKYLEAQSVSSKFNITWAGQTLGNRFEVDGRLKGDLKVIDVPCDPANNACTIPVPSPGFALVFFDSNNQFLSLGQATESFSTSAYTKTQNTARIDPTDLAKSNGSTGKDRAKMGSTSKGSVSGTGRVRGEVLGAVVFGAIFAGILMVAGSR